MRASLAVRFNFLLQGWREVAPYFKHAVTRVQDELALFSGPILESQTHPFDAECACSECGEIPKARGELATLATLLSCIALEENRLECARNCLCCWQLLIMAGLSLAKAFMPPQQPGLVRTLVTHKYMIDVVYLVCVLCVYAWCVHVCVLCVFVSVHV